MNELPNSVRYVPCEAVDGIVVHDIMGGKCMKCGKPELPPGTSPPVKNVASGLDRLRHVAATGSEIPFTAEEATALLAERSALREKLREHGCTERTQTVGACIDSGRCRCQYGQLLAAP